MAVYAITGKLGSGKGKAGIQRLREYIRLGKRVATNCDVFLEHLTDDRNKATVIRVPDKPTATDLYMIGSGNKFVEFTPFIDYTKNGDYVGHAPTVSPKMLPGFDESHNGALVLDECGSWLNTRNFQDKGRSELLEWFIHARKYGWDIFIIMQNISQIDKQIRDSLFEYVVRLNRLDRMRVPIVSDVIKLASAGAIKGNMPRLHIAVVRLGSSSDGLVADRWMFQGDDLHDAYNTTQVFSDTYPHAIHSLLSAWHLSAKFGQLPDFVGPCRPGLVDAVMIKGRTLPKKAPHKHMTKFLAISLILGVIIGGLGVKLFGKTILPVAVVEVEQKFSESITGKGYFRADGNVFVILSDGRIVTPMTFVSDSIGWTAKISNELSVRGVSQ